MKRDWDLIREMLTKVESMSCYDNNLSIAAFKIDSYEERYLASEHMKLLIDKGFVYGAMHPIAGREPKGFSVNGLTWEGHEFLDSIRSDTVWNKTKETFATKGLEMTFETIKAVAAAAMTSMLGLSA